MAKVIGKAGRFAGNKAASHQTYILVIGMVTMAMLGFVEGACMSTLWAKLNLPAWLNLSVQMGGLVGIGVLVWWGMRKIDELIISRVNWKRGADGETTVGKILAKFPDEFYVINGLSTSSGDLDHVVVGPTGVFVLDAKNWRGVVQADGKEELLLNGQPTDKLEIRRFVGRLMGVKEKVRKLTDGCEPYFQGLVVFTAAKVEAVWGKTGSVHCLREDQLWDYIVEKDFGKRLKPQESEKIAQAFQALGCMDKDVTEQPRPEIPAKPVLTVAKRTARPGGVRISPALVTGRGRWLW